MESYAAVVFAVAAVGGLVLAIQHFKRAALSMPLALVHGAAGALGLVLLILGVMGGSGVANAGLALLLFVVAALGGFFLFSHHLRGKPLPTGVVVIHALVAVTAFLILLTGLLGG